MLAVLSLWHYSASIPFSPLSQGSYSFHKTCGFRSCFDGSSERPMTGHHFQVGCAGGGGFAGRYCKLNSHHCRLRSRVRKRSSAGGNQLGHMLQHSTETRELFRRCHLSHRHFSNLLRKTHRGEICLYSPLRASRVFSSVRIRNV